ncbi:MAG: HEPN domain-containing protein [Candidatus Liptonbacteria bacterium]|nr:HEPN domain-containing protein [Candidatus Liptonbacteria bacterium]
MRQLKLIENGLGNGQIVLAQKWLRQATQDNQACGLMLKHKIPTAIICFHAQQTAEKSLKAMIIFYAKKFEKIHDLWPIARTLVGVAPELKRLQAKLDNLSTYYIESRYPDDFQRNIPITEARAAYQVARAVYGIAQRKINSRVKKT